MRIIQNNLNSIIIVRDGLLKDPLWNKEAFVGKIALFFFLARYLCKTISDLAEVFMKWNLLAKHKC